MKQGERYKVVSAPAGEYLTVGDVYEMDYLGKSTVGLHRPRDAAHKAGAGTYVQRRHIESGRIVLQAV